MSAPITNASASPLTGPPPPPPAPQLAGPRAGAGVAPSTQASVDVDARATTSMAREQSADDVVALRSARGGGPAAHASPMARAVERAVGVYLNDGPSALRELVARDPGLMRQLANLDPAEMEGAFGRELERQGSPLRDLISGLDAASMRDLVDEAVEAVIRQEVMREADTLVSGRLRTVAQLHAEIESDDSPRLRELRDAAPGSEDAALAALLGVRGEPGDAARARDHLQRSASGLREFQLRMQGQSWDPAEFPSSAGRAARRLGLEPAWGRVSEGPTSMEIADRTHHVLALAESAHALEQLAHAGVASLGFTTAALGVAVGMVVHHYSAEAHEAHLAFGRGLGL